MWLSLNQRSLNDKFGEFIVIVEDFKLSYKDVYNSWDRLTTKHRYLAQDTGGGWYVYSNIPYFLDSGRWNGSSDWVKVGNSEKVPNYDTLIIDLQQT